VHPVFSQPGYFAVHWRRLLPIQQAALVKTAAAFAGGKFFNRPHLADFTLEFY
jgi:hypothetical protein